MASNTRCASEWKKYAEAIKAKRKVPSSKTQRKFQGNFLTIQRLSADVSGRAQKYARIGPREFVPIDSSSLTPGHNCCSVCARSCSCTGGDNCDVVDPLPFEKEDDIETPTTRFSRTVTEEDKVALKESLLAIKSSYDNKTCSVFDTACTHGFSENLIDSVVEDCANIGTLDYLMSRFPVYSYSHVIDIIETLHEIFEDIADIDEIMEIKETQIHAGDDLDVEMNGLVTLSELSHLYSNETDMDMDDFPDEDRVNYEEIENV